MKAYKLTDQNGRTRNDTQWGENVTHVAPGGGDLCTHGWIHFYDDPLLALLLNPIYANFPQPRLWEAEASGAIKASGLGLKFGCASLTTIREIPLPTISAKDRARFAILCALQVCQAPAWRTWATRWLSGEDCSIESARAAQDAICAIYPPTNTALWLDSAIYAAGCASRAAMLGASEDHAAEAAEAAAFAAEVAAIRNFDLKALAHEAVSE